MPFLFPLLPYVTAYLISLKANFKNITSISETKLTKMAFNDPRMHNTSYAKEWHTLLDSILSALRSKWNREGWASLKVFVYIKEKKKGEVQNIFKTKNKLSLSHIDPMENKNISWLLWKSSIIKKTFLEHMWIVT